MFDHVDVAAADGIVAADDTHPDMPAASQMAPSWSA